MSKISGYRYGTKNQLKVMILQEKQKLIFLIYTKKHKKVIINPDSIQTFFINKVKLVKCQLNLNSSQMDLLKVIKQKSEKEWLFLDQLMPNYTEILRCFHKWILMCRFKQEKMLKRQEYIIVEGKVLNGQTFQSLEEMKNILQI